MTIWDSIRVRNFQPVFLNGVRLSFKNVIRKKLIQRKSYLSLLWDVLTRLPPIPHPPSLSQCTPDFPGSAPAPVHIDGITSAPSTHNDAGAPIHIDSGITVVNDATTQCHISSQSGQVHCHQLTGPVAYPISACVNLKDFVGIFIDVVWGVSFHCLLESSGYWMDLFSS